jgi:outer membrane protein
MRRKVESDSIAHHLNCRRFEEGLLSALDLQTSAQSLHQSRIRLLQVSLTLAMQRRVAAYYETGQIYNEAYGQKD